MPSNSKNSDSDRSKETIGAGALKGGTPADVRSDGTSRSVAARAAAATTNVFAGRRVIPTVDIAAANEDIPTAELVQNRMLAATQVYRGLADLNGHIENVISTLPRQALPTTLMGTLLQPDGTSAARVQIEVDLPENGTGVVQPRFALTNDAGVFTLALPRGAMLADDSNLQLTIRGNSGIQTVSLTAEQIGKTGTLGAVTLPKNAAPLPVSIVASLEAILPKSNGSTGTSTSTTPVNKPTVRLGEDGGVCGQIFGANASVDRFPYSVFIRLVEPRTSILNRAIRFGNRESGFFTIANRNQQWTGGNGNTNAVLTTVERVPVDQPISVDGFRDQIVGTGNGTYVSPAETVPMAGTLGLGYIVNMAQRWTPLGLTLGDLVYSLPLAPGEQQRVAIFERQDTSSVREIETLDEVEQQSFQQLNDSSTEATFSSAFNEMARGGSSFQTEASSSSWGASIILVSGGGGSSSSSGSSSSWMDGQRNYSSRAAEDAHAAVERQAAARRSAARTSMRIASATESEDLTTKVITNHNHTRALTLQYWEVQRLFEVSTAVEGVQLVCLVPLEVVRFLPTGQALTLDDEGTLSTRAQVLARYAQIIKHADILANALPRQYRYGLTLMSEFAADPRAYPESASSAAEDVVQCSVRGTFLPFEEIYVTAVTKRGTRIGPFRMTGSVQPIPGALTDPANAFSHEGELFSALRNRRNGMETTLSASLALPASLARTDVVGFELTRRFQPFDYDFVSPELQAAARTNHLAPFDGITIGPFTISMAGKSESFDSQTLESQLGGPRVWGFNAAIPASGSSPAESYAANYIDAAARTELPPGSFPIPALQLAPVLRYSDLLTMEQMLHHVVRNTTTYSKRVWQSITAEERAIMLEGFTIGVPTGGVTDDTQDVPLLNCVTNQVLGFYGNSMIMPFIIPAAVADQEGFTNSQIQDALADFHRVGFDPPKSTIALPTHGVLGEAVLGHCSSAEKIDLTRFWNWGDSPADTAPTIADVTLPTTTASISAGLTAPNTLGSLQPMINNFNNGGAGTTADTALMQALIGAGPKQTDFTGLTNASDLAGLLKANLTTAESARADALKTTKELTSQAMTEIGNYFGATGGEAYAPNGGKSGDANANSNGKSASGASNSGGKGNTGGGKSGSGASGSGASGSGASGSGASGSGASGSGSSGSGSSGSGSSGSGSSGSGSGSGSGGSGSGSGGTPVGDPPADG